MSRALNPVEKLAELVELRRNGRLSADDFLGGLSLVGQSLEGARAQLEHVRFASDYAAGPVLIEYARTGLSQFAEVLQRLRELAHTPAAGEVDGCLEQAGEAFRGLQELLTATRAERDAYPAP